MKQITRLVSGLILLLLLLPEVAAAEPAEARIRIAMAMQRARAAVTVVKSETPEHTYRWTQGAVANQLALFDGNTYVGAYRLQDKQYLSYVQGQWYYTTIPTTAPEVPQVPFDSTESLTKVIPMQSAVPSSSPRAGPVQYRALTGTFAPAGIVGGTWTSNCGPAG